MRKKLIFGWIALLIISLSPIFLWFYFGPGFKDFNDYSSITHSLGEIFGLVGMTMFAITFILSTRISWIENIFDGLDKVYIMHGILGGTALILILAHPIFLVLKFIPSKMDSAANYLLPSSYWSVNFGIIALLGMMILIFITLFTKIKYHHWKFTHEFLGLMFIFVIIHIFLVRNSISQDNIFDGYYIYATVVSVIGLFGFSYSLFIKNRLFKNAVYSIKSIEREKDIFEITLVPEHKPISYKSGQFIFMRIYNKNISKEAHPFSISSKSNDNNIVIIAKQLGDYTRKLNYLKIGDKVSIEGPYGKFNYEKYCKKDQIWIAGGIGITPFIGMAQNIVDDINLLGKITLIYSVKNKDEIIGDKLFKDISKKTNKFEFATFISKTQGRMDAKTIYDIGGNFKNKEFFLCGSIRFKEHIVKSLVKNGVDRKNIHEEVFDFR